MAKNKRKSSTLNSLHGNGDVDSQASTPSEDETGHGEGGQTQTNSDFKCPHVGKAVNIRSLKKALKTAWAKIGTCSACSKEMRLNKSNGAPQPKDPSKPITILMCLRCGTQLCDDNCPSAHAFKHQEVPRSDSHCIVLNVMTWRLWCYECKQEVAVDSYKKLREVVDFVKKIEETKGRSDNQRSSGTSSKSSRTESVSSASMSPVTTNKSSLSSPSAKGTIPRVRGLSNLGNTCFFNSVMQSLNQSHPLTHVLDQHCQKGAPLNIPSVQLSSKSTAKADEILEPLSLQLAEAGPITMSLAAFFKEMNSVGKQGVYNPGHLFGQVCRKSPQFRGFHQQDAHELLRHLLDGLKAEEVKRQKTAILKNFGLSEKTDPKTVNTQIRKKLQALGRFSNYTLVDKLFGGHLVSTIVCETCHNSSQIYEPFLDLSLPLVEEKPPRPSPKKNRKQLNETCGDDDEPDISCFGKISDDASKSKYQSKKERAKNKREKRRERKNRKMVTSFSKEIKEEEKYDGDLVKCGNQEEEEEEEEKNNKNGEVADEDIKTPNEEEVNMTGDDEKLIESEKANDSVLQAEDDQENHVEKEKSSENEPNGNSLVKSKNDNPDEDEEEDDGYAEGEEDWEWDYGEEWNEEEGNPSEKKDENNSETSSNYIEVQIEDQDMVKEPMNKKLVSMNPLPQELLDKIAQENDKSSDVLNDDESESDDPETGASSNGDVEDNLDDSKLGLKREKSLDSQISEPFHPDPRHLDPHMEKLCRKVRKMSVASVQLVNSLSAHSLASNSTDQEKETPEMSRHMEKIRSNWVARSLTSIAPRYQSSAGECSVYSCLTKFTAPELLTGNNKWACERCTQIQNALTEKGSNIDDNVEEDGYDSSESNAAQKKKKPKTAYSNASKQLLIFSPPPVLTIHLKRFQQTVYNLRKVNRHVDFPLELNLAPFCSSTAMSNPNLSGKDTDILYDLFAVVQHSGSLGSGHYVVYVKVRDAANVTSQDFSQFYSSPPPKKDDFERLLKEVERKTKGNEVDGNCVIKDEAIAKDDNEPELSRANQQSRWFYVSDTHVSEVSVDKVLKCQAYILFYERIK